jgi:hypothetical protein
MAPYTVQELLDDQDASLREIAERVDPHFTTLGRWKDQDALTDEQKEVLADAFGVPASEIVGLRGRTTEGGWVRERAKIEDWRDAVVSADFDTWMLITMMALPSFFDPETGVVSTRPQAIADHMGDKYDVERIAGVWDEVLASELVEKVGEGHWTLKLIRP